MISVCICICLAREIEGLYCNAGLSWAGPRSGAGPGAGGSRRCNVDGDGDEDGDDDGDGWRLQVERARRLVGEVKVVHVVHVVQTGLVAFNKGYLNEYVMPCHVM